MYLQFFGLNDLPFRSTPDLVYFYNDASRGEIVDAISYSLERGDGIVKVIGEVGSGKTTILRKLAQTLPAKYHVIYLNSPNLPPYDILLFICHEFGLEVPQNGHKFVLINVLKNFFIEQHAKGRRCVIMIDEAQSMPIDTLEEVRLLLNLETEQDKLVQVLMFGQPELDQTLDNPLIRQFKTRISHSIYLPPLASSDIHSYLNFRMRKAGYQGRDVFDLAIAKQIARLSKGVLRTIHNIADAALLSAYSHERKIVTKKDLQLDDSKSPINGFKTVVVAFLSLFLITASILAYKFFTQSSVLFQSGLNTIAPEFSDLSEVNGGFNVKLPEPTPTSSNRESMQNSDLGNQAKVLAVLADVTTDEDEINLDPAELEVKGFQKSLIDRLKNKPNYAFSVQVITGGVSDLDRVVKELTQFLDEEALFWVIDPPRYTLYYGYFSNFTQAKESISLLPNSYRIGNPIVVRAERIIHRVEVSITNAMLQAEQ